MCTDVEKDTSANMENAVEQIKKTIGEPRNYGEHRGSHNVAYVTCHSTQQAQHLKREL